MAGIFLDADAADGSRARLWCYVVNGAAVAVAIWGFISPSLDAVLAMAVAPIAALLLLNHFQGIIKFSAPKGSPDPTVFIAFMFPSMMLFMSAVREWHVSDWTNFWVPCALVFVAIFALTRFFALEVRNTVATALVCGIFCAAYAYGLTLDLNGTLGTSKPKFYRALILNKYVTYGKHTTYYFALSPWGSLTENRTVAVGLYTYDKHAIGDLASIEQETGGFGIPFFFVK